MKTATGVVMEQPNPFGVDTTHVSLGLGALAATLWRARISRNKRPWSHIVLDSLMTAALVWLAYRGLTALPERFGGPVPSDIAVIGATISGMLGWETAIRVARKMLGIQTA